MARAGLDVTVLEKKKMIGGSFSENMEAFPEYHYSRLDLPIPSKPVKEVKIFCGDGAQKQRLIIHFQSPVFRLVKRGTSPDSIDSYLFQRVSKTSANVLFGERFDKARRGIDGRIEVLTSSGGSFKCKVLVAADGVFSSVRKVLGMARSQKTEGVGFIAKVEGAQLAHSETIGIFNYSRWPGSYCYLIGYPEEDYATAGMTIRSPYANSNLRKYFDSLVDYLPDILGGSRVVESMRGFVTLGMRNRPLSAGLGLGGVQNVLFVGEAGGFQDPTLAFGLAPALASARLAATTAVQAVSKNNLPLLNEYAPWARRELIRDETRRISFRYILESMTENEMSTFLSYIAGRPEKVEKVMRTGEYVYNFLPMILRSAARNPKLLTFPFRFAKVSRSLKSRRMPSQRS